MKKFGVLLSLLFILFITSSLAQEEGCFREECPPSEDCSYGEDFDGDDRIDYCLGHQIIDDAPLEQVLDQPLLSAPEEEKSFMEKIRDFFRPSQTLQASPEEVVFRAPSTFRPRIFERKIDCVDTDVSKITRKRVSYFQKTPRIQIEERPHYKEGKVTVLGKNFEDSCASQTEVIEYSCATGRRVGANKQIVTCDSGDMCYKGKCIPGCFDTGGLPNLSIASTIFTLSPNKNAPVLQTYHSSNNGQIYCENGQTIFDFDQQCEFGWASHACINGTVAWSKFINWMEDKGYAQEIIDFYQEKYNYYTGLLNYDLLDYMVLREWQRDRDDFFTTFKNSKQGDILTVKFIEVYPIENGWTLHRPYEGWAEKLDLSLEEYFSTRSEPFSKGVGRQVKYEVVKKYINYTEFFFCDTCNYTIIEEEPLPYEFYVFDNETILSPESMYTKHNVSGYYNLFPTITDKQRLLMIGPDHTPKEKDAAIYVFMGAISPDNYFLRGVGAASLCGTIADSSVRCIHTNFITTVESHELLHLLTLTHSSGGLPSNIDSWKAVDWPCFNYSYFYGFERIATPVSPIERYVIEPYDGFENDAEYVQNYNEAVLCP